MARAATTKTTATKTKAKPAPAPEVEEDEEVEVEEAPQAANAVTFGVADLVALIKTKTGKDTTTRELRTLLRKMARDGRLDREIIAGNRARYDWSGPNDPEVKAVLKAFTAGELEADKQEKLQALKDRKAAQKAEKAAAEAKAAKKTKKTVEVVEDEDEDDEEILDEDDE